jgi:hypothetical protein
MDLTFAALALFVPQSLDLPAAYSIRSLAPLDGFELAAPAAIGEDSRIVGSLDECVGFAWSNGTLRLLHASSADVPSRVLGLGSTGFALGSTFGGFNEVATAWDLDEALEATPIVLGVQGQGSFSVSVAANARRLAVGWDDDGITPRPVAFRQTPIGFHTVPLPLAPGHAGGLATDIDEEGRIVGFTTPFGPDQAALWSPEGDHWSWTPLASVAPHSAAVAVAFAEPGVIAGHGVAPGLGNRLLVWVESEVRVLGEPDGHQSFAQDAAPNGTVVGHAIAPDLSRHAIAHPGSGAPQHGIVKLHERLPIGTRWTALREATGVNSRGEIVGYGDLDGRSVGFVLTPVRRELHAPDSLHAGGHAVLEIAGAEPGARVDVYGSLAPGETLLPGAMQSLDLEGARWLGRAYSDADGVARYDLHIMSGAAQHVLHLQAYDSTAGELSQVVVRRVD